MSKARRNQRQQQRGKVTLSKLTFHKLNWLVRKNRLMLFIRQKDYHAVPELIGRNKTLAAYFRNQWERYVGTWDLIFTRTIEGRKLILQSRMKSLAAQFQNKVEHINKWR
ncbi:hypothetical protein SAMN04488511_109208 [Pedobacter suwonensis]|uniref:Uncharacterized protein n=1 Tax=Pedobacter suwonensis TaxID=332999 RepID=A0A1I0TH78_9SPHI|nr:hypothetical protein [Pedobacter suwonensis]SFA50913.1 hypothetical protein SAMN04488511_109208 [Pedobacter suwonensis]